MWLEICYTAHGAGGTEVVYHDLGPGEPSPAYLDELVETSAPDWMRDLTGYTVKSVTTLDFPPPRVAREERQRAERNAVSGLRYLQNFYRQMKDTARAESLDPVLVALTRVLDTTPENTREGERPFSSKGQDTGL